MLLLPVFVLGAVIVTASPILDSGLINAFPIPRSVMRSEHSSSKQHQQTSINLDKHDLNQPANLSITVPAGTQINGQVEIEERVIQRFENESVKINLSRYLKPGRNTVKVTGAYQPQNTRILIEFSSRNNTISQQSGGSGRLQYVLVFDVR
jgi:hypothetical protein